MFDLSYTDPDSDSEGSVHSNHTFHSEKTLSERLEILTNQGLIQVVKVFLDWLRTNTDIILMCAQVHVKLNVCILVNSIIIYLLMYCFVYMLVCYLPKQSSQSLWNRLSVLLNLLPEGSKMLETGERESVYKN